MTVTRPAPTGYDGRSLESGIEPVQPEKLAVAAPGTGVVAVDDTVLPDPMAVGRTEPKAPAGYRSRDRSVEQLFKHPLGGGF